MSHEIKPKDMQHRRHKVPRQAAAGDDQDDGIPDDGGADDGFGEDPGFVGNGTDNGDDGAGAAASSSTRSVARSTSRATSRAVLTSSRSTPSVVVVTSTAQSSAPPPSAAPSSTTVQIASLPTTAAVIAPFSYNTIPRTYNTNLYYSATASPSASSTAVAATGPAIGSMIGMVGGGLVGVVCIAAAIGFFFRRAHRRKDRFDKEEFVRHSVAIQDGGDFHEKPMMGSKNALALARVNNGLAGSDNGPRPPTVFERRTPAVTFKPGQTVNANQYGDDQTYYNNNNPADYNYDYGRDNAGGHYPADQYGAAAGYDGRRDDGNQDQYYGNADDHRYIDDGRQPGVGPYQQDYDANNRQLDHDQDYSQAYPGAGSNAPVGRSLSTTYSNSNPRNPSNGYNTHDGADRSGTPTDRNPQQTYFAPNPPSGNSLGQNLGQNSHNHPRRSVYDDNDAYGGM